MNWGVLGCATIAQRSVIPALLSISENKLVAVSSRSLQTANKLAEEFGCEGIEGYERLLERQDIDAVYIPLPNGLHFEWIMKSLDKGKHVLVEKSAFTSLSEARTALGLAKEKRLALVENFQFQFHAQHQFIKSMLDSGEIGAIRSFRSSFGFPPFEAESNIRYKKQLGGGALLDCGAYVLKATSFMLGHGFRVKAAQLQYHPEYEVDWNGGAFLVNESTGQFSEVAFGFDNYYQCNYEIWGSTGKLTVTRAFTAKADFVPSAILEKGGVVKEITMEKDDHFKNMLIHFNRHIQQGQLETEWEKLLEQAELIESVKQTGQSKEGPIVYAAK